MSLTHARLVGAVGALALAACSAQGAQPRASTPAAGTTAHSPAPVTRIDPTQPASADIASNATAIAQPTVTLQRSGCFGNCPAYTVTVTPDGHVTFAGRAYVQTMAAETQIASDSYAAIVAAMRKADFSTLRASYASLGDGCQPWLTDMPGITITASGIDGKRRSVNFYLGCEGALADAVRPRITQLADAIDHELNTARWIGHATAPGAAVER